MPYPPSHRDATKGAIVSVARRLFNRFGFDRVSIGQIMAEAGLTHGGFYHYFESKSDLYAEAMQCFFTDPGWDSTWEGIEIDRTAADIGPQIIRAYLSRQHFEDIDNSCPMVALPSDVARAGESAKRAYESVFKAMIEILRSGSRAEQHPDRTIALSVAALCVGGMVVARASEDRAFADEVRDACKAVALRLAGWEYSPSSPLTRQEAQTRQASSLQSADSDSTLGSAGETTAARGPALRTYRSS
jgi:TetR/AcrR family transcriptional regulator, transcriptional repressor for nem operon